MESDPHALSPYQLDRRHLLLGGLTLSALPLAPWALSLAASDIAPTFLPLSRFLTGRQDLDSGLGERLYAALGAQFPDFLGQLRALANVLQQRNPAPLQLQALLDAELPALAPWPRRILRAWAMGIVGDGKDTRCVAYEHALNALVVADVLKPPTYAYGGYGSWALPPTGHP